MTVLELIEALQKHAPDQLVYVSGYEGGIDDVTEVRSVDVYRDVNPEHYTGDHDTTDIHGLLYGGASKPTGTPISGVYLG